MRILSAEDGGRRVHAAGDSTAGLARATSKLLLYCLRRRRHLVRRNLKNRRTHPARPRRNCGVAAELLDYDSRAGRRRDRRRARTQHRENLRAARGPARGGCGVRRIEVGLAFYRQVEAFLRELDGYCIGSAGCP